MLQEMLKERTELSTLVELQSLYSELNERVESTQGSSVLELEQTSRMWKHIFSKSTGREVIQQKLQVLHRQLLSQVNTSFYNFITESKYFSADEVDDSDAEDEAYFEEIEMSSFLRTFKELAANDTLYQLLHGHILTK